VLEINKISLFKKKVEILETVKCYNASVQTNKNNLQVGAIINMSVGVCVSGPYGPVLRSI